MSGRLASDVASTIRPAASESRAKASEAEALATPKFTFTRG